MLDLLVNHVVHYDQNNTPSTQYMNDYGSYDASFFGLTPAAQLSTFSSASGTTASRATRCSEAETLYQQDFNHDGKIGNTPIGGGGQTFVGDSTNQTFTGTVAGNDTVDYSQHATAGVTVDLAKTTAGETPGGGQGTGTR